MSSGRNNSRSFKKLRLIVLEEEDWTCYMCGGYATEADHLIPHALGGPDTRENLRAACSRCNKSKGKKMPGQQTTWVNPKYRR